MLRDANALRDDRSASAAGIVAYRPPSQSPVLSAVLAASADSDGIDADHRERGEQLDTFLSAASPLEALTTWMGWRPSSAEQLRQALRLVEVGIAKIDRLIAEQLNAILHHPAFQRLEASWRGLDQVVEAANAFRGEFEVDSSRRGLVIRVLNVSKRELLKDVRRAIEFDQTRLFRKVYEEEFGIAGGRPYGLLVGDYSFSQTPDDLELLGSLAGVAAAAFAPFVAAADPALIAADDFSELGRPLDLESLLKRSDYVKWTSFRERLDSRFVALTVPRILMREPYERVGSAATQTAFREDVNAPDRSGYLWGNAAFGFATVVIRAYASGGWFADIRGVHRDKVSGGLVTGFPAHCFATDPPGVAVKMGTEVSIGDLQEKELCNFGLLPLCECQDTAFQAFFSSQSLYHPRRTTDPRANANERINAMLQYTLCASRFAHYVKVQTRDKVGGTGNRQALQDDLNRWLMGFVINDDHCSPSIKARYPLRSGEVEVQDVPGRPGDYNLIMRFCPHYQLDQMHGSIVLRASFTARA